MIVRNVESGWQVVFQSAHALLAGQIAGQLRLPSTVRYWPETLAAIIDHDEHKTGFGSNVYLTELGAPKDFTQVHLKARERYEEVRRRVDSGYRKHRWIGLLATRHAQELYGGNFVSKALVDYLAEQNRKMPGLLRDLDCNEEELEATYAIFQWCDRTSLILCQSALPAMHRKIEIAALGDGRQYEIWEAKDRVVSVTPWPFQSDSFEAHVEVRSVQQLKFNNDRELEKCLKECAVEDRCWKFQKSDA